MGAFDGILLCTDLDGTLFRKNKTVSSENREAIEFFKREGGYFTFITGRMPYYSQDACRAASPNVPIGCINGGGVYDVVEEKYIFTMPMEDGVSKVVECVDKHFPSVGIQISCFDQAYFAKDNGVMRNFRQITGVPYITCSYNDVDDPIAKILFGSDVEEEIVGVERLLLSHPLSSRFDFVRSERTLFEILPKGVNKGLSLSKLTEYLGVDPGRTIAVGDYYNDIGMFREAGIGIAVANACEGAKAAADYVTVSNEEHAIARIIYDIAEGKYKL